LAGRLNVRLAAPPANSTTGNGLQVSAAQLDTEYNEFASELTSGFGSLPGNLSLEVFADQTPTNGQFIYLDELAIYEGDKVLEVFVREHAEVHNPHDLTIVPQPSSVRNDATGIGDVEPQVYSREYHISDGIETNFPLRLPIFGTTGAPIAQDEFTGNAIDSNKWEETDPSNDILMFEGRLNVTGGLGLNSTKLLLKQGIEIKGKLRVSPGEVEFTGESDAIIGGMFSSKTLTLANCVFGWRLTKSGGQTQIQAIVNGSLVGSTLVTASLKSYAFHILLDAAIGDANLQPWYSLHSKFGGGSQTAPVFATFLIEEFDQDKVKDPVRHQLHQVSVTGVPA